MLASRASITRPRHRNAGRPPEKDAPRFLQWVRGRDCLFAPMGGCSGKIEAAHLDFAGGKGTGTKVADRFAIPACGGHHHLQHQIGWPRFIARMGTTKAELLASSDLLWRAWPGRPKWENDNGR